MAFNRKAIYCLSCFFRMEMPMQGGWEKQQCVHCGSDRGFAQMRYDWQHFHWIGIDGEKLPDNPADLDFYKKVKREKRRKKR